MLRALLFDFNGVLVDDEPLHFRLFRRVMGEEGIAIGEGEIDRFLGRPDRAAFAEALSGAGWASEPAPVARLIERIDGLRAVNAGPLEMARIAEQLTPLLISVNVRYKAHVGLRLVGLPDSDPWA